MDKRNRDGQMSWPLRFFAEVQQNGLINRLLRIAALAFRTGKAIATMREGIWVGICAYHEYGLLRSRDVSHEDALKRATEHYANSS
jgi:hypothetical protein